MNLKGIFCLIIFLNTICFAQAQSMADSVIAKLELLESKEKKIDYLNHYVRTNTGQKAAQMRPYLKETEELLGIFSFYQIGITDLLINKIRFYSYIGKSDSAFLIHKSAENSKMTMEQKAWFYFSEADLFVHNGEQEKGMKSLLSAMKLLEGPVRNESLKAMTLNDIGVVYFMQKDFNNALKYYNQAVELRKKNAEYRALASTYNNIGSVFKNIEKTDSARFYYLKSYEIRTKIADSMGISGVYNNLGVLAEKEKKFELAAEFYNKAFFLGISYGDSLSALPMLINVGNAYWRAKDFQNAEKTLETAIKIAKSSNSSFLESKANMVLAKLFSEKGDHKKAFDLLVAANTLNLKHSNSETLKITKELEAKYENEKNAKMIQAQKAELNEEKLKLAAKEKQQKLLFTALAVFTLLSLIILYLFIRQKQISKKLGIQTKLLDKSNREIELLLREIHHRVKNNLQIVSSLLNIQARSIDLPEAVTALKESQSRIHSIALIHDKLYLNDRLDHIDVPNYLTELSKEIVNSFDSKGRINLIFEFVEIDLNVNMAMQLGIMLNEILTNSLKYAFDETKSPEISILLKQIETDKFELQVKDNGRGIVENVQKKTFGISLIESIAGKINGLLKISSDKSGTSYSIIFSKSDNIN